MGRRAAGYPPQVAVKGPPSKAIVSEYAGAEILTLFEGVLWTDCGWRSLREDLQRLRHKRSSQTMRVFRQTWPGDWTGVMEQIAEELNREKFEGSITHRGGAEGAELESFLSRNIPISANSASRW